ncbi:cell division protein ZapD [Alteromonas oceanisediminis]|uniref:cell division protein ZapD n=1 Tax=Alteromonas oceanisediminis TaxID=2836180 RepID=UPI001BDAE12E|nr:cell division protein ZapD [Alteromonas oceanisediminis]MBT0585538.1 cell division protein ZapD [Alteromonas oceanisediminis]
MSTTVYEFPLNEKVRNYLRIEQLLKQIDSSAHSGTPTANVHFFEDLFTLLDLLERLDIRSDVIKDIDAHERNLLHWSQHPNINNDALQLTLKKIIQLREALKLNKRIGSDLKDDPFLATIRQRFAIPGGACAFDLPNLHYWMSLGEATREKSQATWRESFTVIDEAINLTLSFLRERGRFKSVSAAKGFFPGLADERGELVRVKLDPATGCYPTLSGNKYRYALRFMNFSQTEVSSKPIDTDITFEIASC